MNTYYSRSLIAVAVAAALLAGCASTPKAPAGSAEVRAKLSALQSDANLATKAPLATKDAELTKLIEKHWGIPRDGRNPEREKIAAGA